MYIQEKLHVHLELATEVSLAASDQRRTWRRRPAPGESFVPVHTGSGAMRKRMYTFGVTIWPYMWQFSYICTTMSEKYAHYVSARQVMVCFLIYIGMLLPGKLCAQLDSLLFMTPHAIEADGKGEVRLKIENTNFFINNEYSGRQGYGYTLPGFELAPTLSYQPIGKLRVEAGVHLLRYWGTERYPSGTYRGLPTTDDGSTGHGLHCTPLFRADLQVNRHFSLTIGSLYGQGNHDLCPQLYHDELNLTADPEAGLQLRWESAWVDAETWVDWEKFIYRNDNHQEQLTYGLTSRFKFHSPSRAARWSIPVQVIAMHHGGEINRNQKNREISTVFNAAAGLCYEKRLRSKRPAGIKAEVMGLLYRQAADNIYPLKQGYGLHAAVTAGYASAALSLSYFMGHKFVTLLGDPLYNCYSERQKGLIYRQIQRLSLRAEYAKDLGKGCSWGVMGEASYMLSHSVDTPPTKDGYTPTNLDYTVGIFLRFAPSFLLKRLK